MKFLAVCVYGYIYDQNELLSFKRACTILEHIFNCHHKVNLYKKKMNSQQYATVQEYCIA